MGPSFTIVLSLFLPCWLTLLCSQYTNPRTRIVSRSLSDRTPGAERDSILGDLWVACHSKVLGRRFASSLPRLHSRCGWPGPCGSGTASRPLPAGWTVPGVLAVRRCRIHCPHTCSSSSLCVCPSLLLPVYPFSTWGTHSERMWHALLPHVGPYSQSKVWYNGGNSPFPAKSTCLRCK